VTDTTLDLSMDTRTLTVVLTVQVNAAWAATLPGDPGFGNIEPPTPGFTLVVQEAVTRTIDALMDRLDGGDPFIASSFHDGDVTVDPFQRSTMHRSSSPRCTPCPAPNGPEGRF
jgi:hypothetical protein